MSGYGMAACGGKKSFLAEQRKFLGPLMRFVRGNVRDHTDSPKSTTDLRNGAKERCSGREV
jgi:hypothetical protein